MPGKLGARKDAQWMAISIEPSIDNTWIGPARVPIPYTVTSSLSTATGTSSNVKFNGQPVYLLDQSTMLKCIGDENGGGGGIHSGINLGEVKPIQGSSTVKVNGKSVVREGDLCTMNKENCRGKFMATPTPLPVSAPPPAEVWVDIRLGLRAPGQTRVPVQAFASPGGGVFEWKHSRNCRLVDSSGARSHVGKSLWIETRDETDDAEVEVSVVYKHPNGEASASKDYRTHNEQAVRPVGITQLVKETIRAATSDGFIVVGSGNPSTAEKKTDEKKKKASIACFIDGTDNDMMGRSNIRLMYEAIFQREENGSEEEKIFPKYYPGPGAKWWDVAGDLTGRGSMGIADVVYEEIAWEYATLKEEGYAEIEIDIYGFSRGAAIANEIGWIIDKKGIQEEDQPAVEPPKGVKVRFLGLFDTVHSMVLPGEDSSKDWHDKTIAPIVENCAHAFAANETRVYFTPSVLQRIGDTQLKEMIFPGVHSDVGGHRENNQDVMNVTRSWIANHATKAGVLYLRSLVISEQLKETLKRKLEKIKFNSEKIPLEELTGGKNPLYFADRIDGVAESLPLVPNPTILALRYLAKQGDPFAGQPEELHERRKWERYRIPWFISGDASNEIEIQN